ncbi:MAG TPA: class I SAM-dependent methyltransferase [Gaiellaceae bacterium]|nr:class I SAM-dependent methyltransferase [Gaiellaceae bacterium]
MNAWDPVPDLEVAAALGKKLRAAGYTEDAITARLGEDGPAADSEDVPVLARRLGNRDFDELLRLLLLNLPVERRRIDGADELVTLGFAVRDGEQLVPRGRIIPTEGLYLAFDTFSVGLADPPGWVASFTPTSYWLACVTPRPRVRRALDVGTGNGAHALFAARHADHVIATDVNQRALDFTAIGAALNGFTNVETRQGSFFEPVEGETFGLITCNAPYVVSPERRWQYRDAGGRGDEVSELVVRESAAHLEDGGYAAVSLSWLAASRHEPDSHFEDWIDGSSCDAWLIGLHASDPLDHAAAWTDHLQDDAAEEALERWTSYIEELGATWVSEGVAVLRKREGSRFGLSAEAVEEDELEHAGDQAVRILNGLALLSENRLAGRRFKLVDDAMFRQELDNEGDSTELVLALDGGTHPEIEIEPDELDLLTRPFDAASVGDELLRDLLEGGFVEPA